MATHTGSEGTVKIGSTAVAEIRSYTLNENGDTLEDTSMGDTARTYKPSLKSFDGSLDVFWVESDVGGQDALTVEAEITFSVYPEGSTTGDVYYTGSAIVTSRSITASYDGMVEMSIGIQGNGALTSATVS
jgi:predicted secreted protein